MIGLIFAALFGLNFWLFPCKGRIYLPPNGDTFIVLPGENVTIMWTFDDNVSDVLNRSWEFVPNGTLFAQIVLDRDVNRNTLNFPRPFTIKKPSTLILKNVNIQYNGTYRFTIQAHLMSPTSSEVTVFVAVKPNVAFSCSSPIIVGEGDNATCVCRGDGGNPPANVTWFKDGIQIGKTGKDEQKLTLSNVSQAENGIYKCVAQSHTNSMFVDEKSIELIVKQKRPTTQSTPITSTSFISFMFKTSVRPPVTTPTHTPTDDALLAGAIGGIIAGVLTLGVIVIVVVCCCKPKEADYGKRRNAKVSPAESAGDDEGVDDACDTVSPSEVSRSKSKPPEDTLPAVYAVDRNNREGKTLNATLDTIAMQPSEQKNRDDDCPDPTEYASIDFNKTGKTD